MSTPLQLSLLRRTFAVFAAALALGAASDALAQGKVKLTGASGKDECLYSSMSITPDGSVNVTCSGTTTPPPPPPPPATETYAMSVASISAQPYTVVEFAVTRSGPAGTVFAASTVNFTYSGAGCAITGTYPVAFAADQMSSPIQSPVSAGGTCVAALVAPPSPAALGSPSTTTITVGSGTTPPPPPPPSSCPTGFVTPENMISSSLTGFGNPLIAMQKSGQVISIPLPNLGALNTGQITFGESSTAATPQPVTIEISINKCPGLIETDATNSCNLRSTMSSYNSITWFAKAYSIITDSASASRKGYCWGGDAAQYYVNARWTYQFCPFGAQVCGFAIQYNQGPY